MRVCVYVCAWLKPSALAPSVVRAACPDDVFGQRECSAFGQGAPLPWASSQHHHLSPRARATPARGSVSMALASGAIREPGQTLSGTAATLLRTKAKVRPPVKQEVKEELQARKQADYGVSVAGGVSAGKSAKTEEPDVASADEIRTPVSEPPEEEEEETDEEPPAKSSFEHGFFIRSLLMSESED